MRRVATVRNAYFDSVFLMSITTQVKAATGVVYGMLGMGTPANCQVIVDAGFDPADLADATPNDLLIAVEADDKAAAIAAIARAEELVSGAAGPTTAAVGGGAGPAVSLPAATAGLAGANLALISVPGEYAAREAAAALDAGLHAMVFSDNVSLEDEVWLKQSAHDRGLLVMGPDCGTAALNGIPLGFANVVRRGPVGLVGASGTGMQEVMCLLDRLGAGVSQAIGTGGRDVGAAVGAITALDAIAALASHPETQVIGFVSKPPDPTVAGRILDALAAAGKPAVAAFLGAAQLEPPAGVQVVDDLTAAALGMLQAAGLAAPADWQAAGERPSAAQLAANIGAGRRFVRGLFCGGTLAAEAEDVLSARLGVLHATHARPGVATELVDPHRSIEHTVVDMGDDAFTQGKPHPMIDPAERNERLRRELSDDQVALILIDCVLGYGSHDDPAGAMEEALDASRAAGVPVLASVTGTEGDPQRRSRQVETLQRLKCVVLPSNRIAAQVAADVVGELAR